jgi:hypothetical protein
MAIRRQQNWLGQQRVDVSDLRALESGVANDFDALAGKLIAGRKALIIRGFTIPTTSVAGAPADQLTLSVARGLVLHYGATEAGTVFSVDDNAASESLAATNAKVSGSFVANATNYIGIDLRRSEDATTSDLKQFLDANSKLEVAKTVPTARTLSYKIIVSTQPFSINSTICPIAKVVTNSSNNVVSVTDARQLMFRLGSGGDTPNQFSSFTWTDSDRIENAITYNPPTSSVDPFAGGDKEITNLKDWMDAVMSRLWELGSGQFWYGATARDRTKLLCGSPVISATGDNFQWDGGTNTLTWSGLAIAFENSTAYYNTITDGSAVLSANGQCLYVDIDRTTAAALVPSVALLTALGTSTTKPGSRFIIAWRQGNLIHIKDRPYEVGRVTTIASTTALGVVKLNHVSDTPTAPVVAVVGSDGQLSVTQTNNAVATYAILGTGMTIYPGVVGQGGPTNATGVHGIGGGSNGTGVLGDGVGTGYGVKGATSGTGAGLFGVGGSTTGTGLLTQKAALANRYAQIMAKDQGGNSRWRIDHTGYVMGRINKIDTTFLISGSGYSAAGTSVLGGEAPGWTRYISSSGYVHGGTVNGNTLTCSPTLHLNASGAGNVTSVFIHRGLFNSFTGTYDNQCFVAEWDASFQSSNKTSLCMGFAEATAGAGFNVAYTGDVPADFIGFVRQGVTPSMAVNTWTVTSRAGGTGMPSTFGTTTVTADDLHRFRIEWWGAGTPVGANTMYFFIDGTLVATVTGAGNLLGTLANPLTFGFGSNAKAAAGSDELIIHGTVNLAWNRWNLTTDTM